MSQAPKSPILKHDDLADLFLHIGALQPPAELHGYATGYIAVGGRAELSSWLDQCAELLDIDKPNPALGEPLYAIYQSALNELQAGDMGLTLLLPGDEFELEARIASLGQWCQGFLTGFAMAAKMSGGSLADASDDLKEALNDLAAIAQISADQPDAEEGEQDFFEVCEYVRVVAMTIYAECHQADTAGEADTSTNTNTEQGPPAGHRLH